MSRAYENDKIRVTMPMEMFQKVIDQLRPWTAGEWRAWERFVRSKYGISPDGMGENHFFLYIIPKVLVLHGYGEPLLDRYIVERVRYIAEKGIPSYFSATRGISRLIWDRTSLKPVLIISSSRQTAPTTSPSSR